MEKIIKFVNIGSVIAFLLYLKFMFITPWLSGDWDYVQSVWHSWQSLNVGLLAFASSVIAFNIAKYNSEKQRSREFVSARSFLPEALSELTRYFNSCVPLLSEAWSNAEKQDLSRSPLKSEFPIVPVLYKETFSRCITHADPKVAEYLAKVLMKLQIHQSRLESIYNSFYYQSHLMKSQSLIESHIFCLAELQSLVNQLFSYSRSGVCFDNSPLTLDRFSTAYSSLGIHVENYNDLWAYTSKMYVKCDNT